MSCKPLLYIRTLRHLRPSMLIHRLLPRRTVRAEARRSVGELTVRGVYLPEIDCAEEYAGRFDVDALKHDEFLMLSERHRVDLETWHVGEASHLWNFNLHYFEYAVPLALRYREAGDGADLATFKRLVNTWISACTYPDGAAGDAWHPYTISLRLVNWLICIELLGDVLTRDVAFWAHMQDSMYRQYRHLLVNQEKHLRANHYLDNLKTCLICATLFGEDKVYAVVERDLVRQLAEQILPDGMHFERSCMYHRIMLESLLRALSVTRSCGHPVSGLEVCIGRMRDAMCSLERGVGKTPAFNDSGDGVAKSVGALEAACVRLCRVDAAANTRAEHTASAFLPDAGYAVFRDGGAAAIVNTGSAAYGYETGHMHCDALSYELSFEGRPLVVNAGTYAYQDALRPYFRSTEAHNTAQYESCEQLELWSDHKVGRMGHAACMPEVGDRLLVASYVTFEGHVQRRELSLRDGLLRVRDSFPDEREGVMCSRVHFAPNLEVDAEGDALLVRDGGAIVALLVWNRPDIVDAEVSRSPISYRFGELGQGVVICFRAPVGQGISYEISYMKEGEGR